MVRSLGRWACVALAWALLAFAGGGAWAQLPTGALEQPKFSGPPGSGAFHNADAAKRASNIVREFHEARNRCDVRGMDAALAKLEALSAQLPPLSPGQMVRIPAGAPKYDIPEARSADGSQVRNLLQSLRDQRKNLLDCVRTTPFRNAAQEGLAAADAAIKKCDLEAYENAIADLNTASARLRGAALRREGEFKDASDATRSEALREADRLRNLSRHLSAQKAAAFKDCKKPTRVGQATPAQPATPRPSGQLPASMALPNTGFATLIFEAGGLGVSSATSTIDCPACPGAGAQSVSPSGGFAGADLRVNLLAIVAATGLPPIPFTENFILSGPFVGMRLRRYFNYSGDVIAFDFHPGVGDDTSMRFETIWSYKAYVGLQFMMMFPQLSVPFAAVGLAPYVGVNVERSRLTLTTDELGPVTQAERQLTRNGMAYGLDVDFYFRNLPFFIGLGLQWDRMPETSISMVSTATGFAYRGVIPGRTSFTTAVRIGIPLGGNLAQ